MTHYVYVCIGARGHLFPSLAVVKELIRRGDRVTYLVPPWARELVVNTGAEVECYDAYLLKAAPRKVDGFRVADVPVHAAREVVAATDRVVGLLRSVRPDALLVDGYTHAGFLAAEATGLPMARMETSYLPGAFNYYREAAVGRLRGRMTSPESLAAFSEMTAPVFLRHGLAPRPFEELVCRGGVRNIVFVARAFHPEADRYGPETVFVGPAHDAPSRPASGAAGVDWPHPRWARPRVYVSFGSVFTHQPGFLDLFADAAADLDLDAVVVAGHILPDDMLRDFPPNVSAFRAVEQLGVLPEVDLFVTHGGMNSTMESLWFGVPVLVVPQFPEQLATALRCEALGVGRHLDREAVSITTLRRQLAELLADPGYAERARALAARMREDGGARRACDEIQAAFGRRPAARGADSSPARPSHE